MVSRTSFRPVAVRAEAPDAVDALHLMDDAGLSQRFEGAVERHAVEVFFDFREYLGVRERGAAREQKLQNHPSLARRGKPCVFQRLFYIQSAFLRY